MAERPEFHAVGAWAYSNDRREAIREKALTAHQGDLWVFAYGSLMWDPALRFESVRRAYAPGHARRFVFLEDKGGRGTATAPGLVAALDTGAGCEGFAFRIASSAVDAETEILFRRELLGPSYTPAFIPVWVGKEKIQALTFLADHNAPVIRANLTREQQVRYIATGKGFLGTSRDYLTMLVDQLNQLGIEDPECRRLLIDVDSWSRTYLHDTTLESG